MRPRSTGMSSTQWDTSSQEKHRGIIFCPPSSSLALPCVFPSPQDSCSRCWLASWLLPCLLSTAPMLLPFPRELFPSVFPCAFSCLSAKIEKQVQLQFFKAFSKPVELPKMGGKDRKKRAKQHKNATEHPEAARKTHP